MEIQYFIKSVYGNELMYIKRDDIREFVRNLTGRKTISQKNLEALTNLGFKMVKVLR
jgi:hypothetical protein